MGGRRPKLRKARALVLCALGVGSALVGAGSAGAATLPAGFQETTAFSGLTNPVTIKFSPDGRIFIAEKSGLIKVYDGLEDTTPTTFADLRTQVHNFWDRGMLGMELAPNFPADPYVYVLYTHDAAIGGTAPRWGTAGATSDGCPSPPGPTGDGCVVSGRLSRLQAQGSQMTGPEQVLIEDWCQQYPSHSVGDIEFGADGKLYVSGGDGASFNFTDWGQDGNPVNPCGDPPGGPGTALTPPSAEGGALRSQDVRTAGSGGSGGTHLLRPNADVTSQWVVCCNTELAWQALDDPVTAAQGPVAVEDFLYEFAQGDTTEVALSTVNLGGAPTAGRAWFYSDSAPGQTIRADVIWGGSVRASKTISSPDGTERQWHSIDVVPPDQAAVDDLRLRFTVTQAGTSTADVFAAYFELTAASGPSTDPTGLDGSVLRVDPATGAGLPDNPLGSSPDPNARRMIGFGLRNPFRFAIRPGTNEVWLGDVGWGTWEEINRIAAPTDGNLDNFGWPCYEGTERQIGYDNADLSLCESLYANPQIVNPHFAWNHGALVVPGESCPTGGGSSVSGVDFYGTGPYPDAYDGAMFFADYSRNCIWAMQTEGGLPSPSKVLTFAAGATNPVDVTVGPGGEIFYPDFHGGTIKRISFASANQPPVAVADASPTSGPAPLTVQFSGSRSSDPDAGDTLSYAWDLDNDGAFDDSTSVSPSRTYAAGVHTARLRVTDAAGASSTASVTINSGNSPPTANMSSPSSTTTWQVGQTISFSGSGTDAQDGTIPASRMSWSLILNHCPSACHTHPIQTFSGVSSGSFVAPDHEYPSHLSLALTVTDSGGLSHTVTRTLQPRTYSLTMRTSNPTGLNLTLNSFTGPTQFSRTVIRNSTNTISAPSPQSRNGRTYAFSRWSDGGARTHNVIATANRTFTAYFTRVSGAAAARAACVKLRKKAKKRGKARAKRKRRC